MRKRFIIQDLVSKEYWYGYYTNKTFTDNVEEAKLFEYIEDVESQLQMGDFQERYITIITIYI